MNKLAKITEIDDMYEYQVEELLDIYKKYIKDNKGKDIEFSNIDLSNYARQ